MSLRTDIPLLFREKIEEEIIPELIEAGKNVLIAHSADPENFDNYFVGCACWNNVFSRLVRLCSKSNFFSGKPYGNTLEVKAVAESKPISFYVARVDEKTRIPNAGKSIKRLAQEQLFLSDEVRTIAENSGVYTLGYDINHINGLGVITFDILTYISQRNYQPTTIFTFDVNLPEQTYTLTAPETVAKPAVTRKEATENTLAKKQAK